MTFVTFPLLAVLAVLAVAAGLGEATVSFKPTVPSTYQQVDHTIPKVTEHALHLLNAIRASKGLKPLCLNQALQASAQAHSNWMASTSQMKHAPDTFQRMERHGYPGNTVRAENVAVNQNGNSGDSKCFGYGVKVSDIMSSAAYSTNCAWYTSPEGHYENMMGDFNQVGIAYAIGNYHGRPSYYWTQNFGKSSQPYIGNGGYTAPKPSIPKSPTIKKPVSVPSKPNRTPIKKPVVPVPNQKPAFLPSTKKPVTLSKGQPAKQPSLVKVKKPVAYKNEAPKPTLTKPQPTNVVDGEYVAKPVTRVKKCKSKAVVRPVANDNYGKAKGDNQPAKLQPTTPAADYSYGEPVAA